MKTLHKKLLVGFAVLGMGTATFAAHAEKEGCDRMAMAGHEGGPGKFGEHMRERMAKHQAELHDKLKLSAAQESGWKTFVASMMPPAGMKHEDRGSFENISAPERMEKMQAMMKEHEAQMGTRLTALKTFYATLTPEQQKIFDANFGPGHHRGDHHRDHRDNKPQ